MKHDRWNLYRIFIMKNMCTQFKPKADCNATLVLDRHSNTKRNSMVEFKTKTCRDQKQLNAFNVESDPVIIERTIDFLLSPSTALYTSFLEHCTLTDDKEV